MNKNFFKNKSLLITGGTGSFGKAFVNYLLLNKVPLKKIVIFNWQKGIDIFFLFKDIHTHEHTDSGN